MPDSATLPRSQDIKGHNPQRDKYGPRIDNYGGNHNLQLFGGLEEMPKAVGPENWAQIQASTYYSPNQESDIYASANISYAAEVTGSDVQGIADNWEVYRSRLAQQLFPDDLASENITDTELYTKIGDKLRAEFQDKELRSAVQTAGINAAQGHLLGGSEDVSMGWEAFQETLKSHEAYDEERTDEYHELYRGGLDAVIQQDSTAANVARDLLPKIEAYAEDKKQHTRSGPGYGPQITGKKDSELTAERDLIIDELMAIDPDEVDSVFGYIARMTSQEDKDHGFSEGFSKSLIQWADNNELGGDRIYQEYRAGAMLKNENIRVPKDITPAELSGYWDKPYPTADSRKATPAELEAIHDGARDGLRRSELESKLVKAIHGDIDPVIADAWYETMGFGVAKTLPYMALSMSGTGLAVKLGATGRFSMAAGGAAATAPNLIGSAYDKYRSMGVSPDNALPMATADGSLVAAIEGLQAITLMGKIPVVSKLIARLGPQGVIGKFAVNTAATYTLETSEEYLQEVSSLLVQEVSSFLADEVPGVTLTEAHKQLAEMSPELLLTMIPFALLGGGGQALSQQSEQNLSNQLRDPYISMMFGIPEVDAVRIAEIEDAKERSALFTELRDIPRTPAEIKANQQLVIEGMEALQDSINDAGLKIEKGEDGYVVIFPPDAKNPEGSKSPPTKTNGAAMKIAVEYADNLAQQDASGKPTPPVAPVIIPPRPPEIRGPKKPRKATSGGPRPNITASGLPIRSMEPPPEKGSDKMGPGAANTDQPFPVSTVEDESAVGDYDGAAVLQEVDTILTPKKKEKAPVKDRILGAPQAALEAVRDNLISEYRPLDRAQNAILDELGAPRPAVPLSRHFEQVAGAVGKAEADVRAFDRSAELEIKGLERDADQYIFLKRTLDRLTHDPDVKQVEGWTREKAQAGLNELRERLGVVDAQRVEDFAETTFQAAADAALQQQVASGRLSPDVYNEIKDANDFYAPFKVLKWFEEQDGIPTGGKRIDTRKELTQAITGIHDEDFRIESPIQALKEQIFRSRILAEKNKAMLLLDGLADLDASGLNVKRLKWNEKPPEGMDEVLVSRDGKRQRLAVPKKVMEAVKGLNAREQTWLGDVARAVAIPFKAGATAFNAAFQVVNIAGADMPKLALISKFGIKDPVDFFRFFGDAVRGFYASLLGNLGIHNERYMDFLRSGAAFSTFQKTLIDSSFQQKQILGIKTGKANKTIKTLAGLASVLEETTKITGMLRGLRQEGFNTIEELEKAGKLPALTMEVRNYAGSPDFSRSGSKIRTANLVFMFLNARIQGTTADISRLAGASGKKAAAVAQLRMAAAVGIPTVALMIRTIQDDWDDYEKVPERERENYWIIFQDGYFTNQNGEKVRNAIRIPKREVVKLYSNFIESSLIFLAGKEPDAFKSYAEHLGENLLPISFQGDDMGERMESLVSGMNPIIKVPLELAMNRNTYYHQPVVPSHLEGVDPEDQYYKNTPDWARGIAGAMPGFAPEGAKSPLYMEHFIKGTTAGLITQFVVKDPEGGREGWTEWPVLKRFVRSPHIDKQHFYNEIEKFETAEDTERAKARHRGDEASEQAEIMLPADRRVFERELKRNSPRVYGYYKKAETDKELGIDGSDRRIKALGVESEARAGFIVGQLRTMDVDERNEWYADLTRKKVISTTVRQQIEKKLQEEPLAGGVDTRPKNP